MTERSLDDLVAQLSSRDGIVREQARHDLVLMGPVAVPALLGLLEGKVKQTRWEAAKALAVIADPSTSPALVALMQDPNMDIRWIASMGLVKIGPDSLEPILQRMVEDPDSTDLRRAVHHVLHELAKKSPEVHDLVQPVMDSLGEGSPTEVVLMTSNSALERLSLGQRISGLDW